MTTSETRDLDSLKTDETRRIERKLRAEFPTAEAYRFNSASIRIRILDERFAELSNPDRESLTCRSDIERTP